jgi:hypothetical protein
MRFWLIYLAACLIGSYHANDVQQVILLIPAFFAIYWIFGLLFSKE